MQDSTHPAASLNRAIISDILLWIALAVLAGAAIWYVTVQLPIRRGNVIVVHFRDANEITRGSIVRMMGTEIGYVNDVRLKQDHVDVVIHTNPGSLPVPSGSLFTVQFTGLVGSKSIEIVPPNIPRPVIRGQPLYLVEEPIRMKDMQKYQLDITQDLQAGAENIADFFGKKKSVEELQINIQQFHKGTHDTMGFLDQVDTQLRQLDEDLTASISESTRTLGQFGGSTAHAVHFTRPATLEAKMQNLMGFFRRLNQVMMAQGSVAVNATNLQGRLSRLNLVSGRIGAKLHSIPEQLAGFPYVDYLGRFNAQQERILAALTKTDAYFETDRLPIIRRARTKIRNFNRSVESLNGQADRLIPKLKGGFTPDETSTFTVVEVQPNASEAMPRTTPQTETSGPRSSTATVQPRLRPTGSGSASSPSQPSATTGTTQTPPAREKTVYSFGLSGCSDNR